MAQPVAKRPALIVGSVAAVVGCLALLALAVYWASRPIDNLPFQQRLAGNGVTPWIKLGAGMYNIEVRQDTSGCSVPVRFADQAGDRVVYLEPYAVGFGGGPIVGPTNWYGQTGPLPTGEYRFTGLADGSCRLSVRLSRFTPPTSSGAR
jgi:hypothetical protein